MRFFEILTAACLALYFAWRLFVPRLRYPRLHTYGAALLAAAGLLSAAASVLVEGYRWQMLPLIALAFGVFLFTLARLFRPAPSAASRRSPAAGGLAGLLLVGLAVALPALFPVASLPFPTGLHPIGAVTWHLVDTARQELYSGRPGEPRELMVQAWYPASPAPGDVRAPWMGSGAIAGPAIARQLRLPPFALNHIRLVRTHAFENAALAPDTARYPVLLFSHGWSGFRQQNTFQVEELASHGYVVVAIQHTYASAATVFPNGRVAPMNRDTLPRGLGPEAYFKAANQLVGQWAGDLDFVLDHLADLDAADPQERFTGRLDLERVGVFGHSTGGGAAAEFCGRDGRCKAALAMDAYLIPVTREILARGLDQPALFMFSERWPEEENTRLFEELYGNTSGRPAVHLSLAGTDHYDFTDLPIFSPLAPVLGLKGPLEGRRVLRIVNDYSLAFFGQTLQGQARQPLASNLLAGPSEDYPEVTFRSR